MKHVMKSLKHNGIFVPPYDYKGFSVIIQGKPIKLTGKTEPMAVAWERRNLSTTIAPPDTVFRRNFMKEFLGRLRQENSKETFLDAFSSKYLANVDDLQLNQEIDFTQIKNFILQEKAAKEAITKEVKKQQAQERKVKRLEFKEKYGYAEVDGQKLEVANWTSEPSCLFAGRGDHPQRGKWKDGPTKSDVILNLSDETERVKAKQDGWKDAVWEPNKMYVAKWEDKLTGKIKYVWFSDTAFLKQNREKEKFQKAETLGKQIKTVEQHIMRNLSDKDEGRRKVATVAWLIFAVNMRVGDEKDPDEADTVGAITLRAEHIKINGNQLNFHFLGKDSVEWDKTIQAPPEVIRNIQNFMQTSKQYLFEGVDSKKVAHFLSEKVPKLSAKVFRTWKCTSTLETALKKETEKEKVTKDSPDYKKGYVAKMANYEVAVVANHKKKVPPTFEQRVAQKEENFKKLQAELVVKKAAGKKTESLETRIERAKLDIELTKLTREYNLGTSLKSYIDPTAYVKWAKKVKFDIEKFYPTTLRNKFSWALHQGKTQSSCDSECIPP